ncbi:MAG TPA: TAXI family TRAP transporter solute-binding subunit [Methylomirabilota bacterium]|jgi:TRAP transporter TAXI family solute receptor
MRRGRPGGLVALVAVLLLVAAAGCAPAVRPTSLASGAVGGIYQPIAETIAKIARETPGLPLTVEATGASVANVQLLSDGKVQLALVQNDIAYYAAQGTTLPVFRGKKRSNLRAIVSIYPEYVQLVAARSAGISSVEGLRGKRVALGPEGSGTEQNALQVLEASGLKVTDLGQGERIDTAEAVTRMKAGQLDAAFFTVGAGSPLVGDLLGGTGQLVPVTRQQIARLITKVPFYWLDEIPAGTYPGQAAAVSTPSLRVLLLTTDNAEEGAIYGLTKALLDNLPALRAAHPAVAGLSTDTVLRVVTVPLHPGALRLYRERNIQQ